MRERDGRHEKRTVPPTRAGGDASPPQGAREPLLREEGVMASSSSAPSAHPLAGRLLALARERPLAGPVIEVGAGAGRNTRALVEAGVPLVSVPDDVLYTQLPGNRELYGAALSTHAYLHGAAAKVRAGFRSEERRAGKAGRDRRAGER